MSQKRLFEPPDKRWHGPVARLLWLANSDAGKWKEPDRYGFYRLKGQILKQYAAEDGIDWQEIKHHCYACDGTGTWGHWRKDGGDFCYKCNGTGVYQKFYVRLHRYQLGTYVFHVPGERFDSDELESMIPPATGVAVIHGKILHTHIGTKAKLAHWTLCLIFDRKQLTKIAARQFHAACKAFKKYLPTRCNGCRKILWTPHSVAARGHGHLAWCKECSDKIPF